MTYKNADKLKVGCILVHRNGGRTRCDGLNNKTISADGLNFYRSTGQYFGKNYTTSFDIVDIEDAPEPITGWVNVFYDGFGTIYDEEIRNVGLALLKLTFDLTTRQATVEVVE